MLRGPGQKLGVILAIGDLAATIAAWLGAYAFRFSSGWFGVVDNPPLFHWCLDLTLPVALFTVLSGAVTGAYRADRLRRMRQEIPAVFASNFLILLLIVSTTFYVRSSYESRLALGIFYALSVCGVTVVRSVIWRLVHTGRGAGINPTPALIVGNGRTAVRLAQAIERSTWTGIRLVGFIASGPGGSVGTLPELGDMADIQDAIAKHRVSYVFIALPLTQYGEIRDILQQLQDALVQIEIVPDVPRLVGFEVTQTELEGMPVLSLGVPRTAGIQKALKRAVDVAGALAGLLLLSPLLAAIALLIKSSSRGPVLYFQERAGINGETFRMLKFRSMRVDAEEKSGPVWAVAGDARRTRIGAFLRRTNLDELPQLVNVLRGDMSLVGPRPERPHFVAKFRDSVPRYMLRHAAKAGMTGWAQIHGWRGNTSLRKRVQYDLYYITHWSIWLDLRIMALTLLRGFRDRNAY